MALPDLSTLADASGWVVAVGVLLAVVTLLVRGDLVPRVVHDRALKRGDELDKTVSTLANEVRSQNVLLREMNQDMAVLVDRGKR